MVFDSPKAAHFNVFANGKKLDDLDPAGLALRWAIAHRCRDVISDMLNLTLMDRIRIGNIMAEVNNENTGVYVQLRSPEQSEGTQS